MSEAGKGDNTSKRTNFRKFWDNYPKQWKKKEDIKKFVANRIFENILLRGSGVADNINGAISQFNNNK